MCLLFACVKKKHPMIGISSFNENTEINWKEMFCLD